jgi:hypothetical protein
MRKLVQDSNLVLPKPKYGLNLIQTGTPKLVTVHFGASGPAKSGDAVRLGSIIGSPVSCHERWDAPEVSLGSVKRMPQKGTLVIFWTMGTTWAKSGIYFHSPLSIFGIVNTRIYS